MEWLAPWEPISAEQKGLVLRRAWEAELKRELGPGHALYGLELELIGLRFDCDDALYQLSDGRVARVHVTWKRGQETDIRWPSTEVYASLSDWAEQCLQRDHNEWSCGQGEADPS